MDADVPATYVKSSDGTAADDAPSEERSTRRPDGRHSSSDALAFATFVCVAIGAFAFYLIASRRLWFADDDWDFLAGRSATSLHDLFRSHYGHWSTVPILVYRLWWSIFGLRSYTPYLFLVIALHVAVASLSLAVMRRVGVGAWTAVAAASLYLFFGTGAQDIFWAFQIGYKGALAFGLAHLLLADHDRGVTLRDWIGLGFGFAALMCSAVGVVMAGVVALAMLLRRGWRIALFHAGPLFGAYVVWWSAIGHEGAAHSDFTPSTTMHWVLQNLGEVFSALTKGTGVAWLLGIVVLVGVISALASSARATRQLALPLSLAVGGVAFVAIASLARSTTFGGGNPRSSRYEDIVTAMLLPLIAVGVDQLRIRWRVLGIAAVALLLLGIPANIAASRDYVHAHEPTALTTRRLVTTLAFAPMAHNVPRSVKPLHEFPQLFVTTGWLLDGANSGRIPNPGPLSPADLQVDDFRLSILQTSNPGASDACHPVVSPEALDLEHGASIVIGGAWPLVLSTETPSGQRLSLTFSAAGGNLLVLVGDATHIRIASKSPLLPGSLCQS